MSRSLDDLRPEVRPQVDAFLAECKAQGLDLIVTCTSRTDSIPNAPQYGARPSWFN